MNEELSKLEIERQKVLKNSRIFNFIGILFIIGGILGVIAIQTEILIIAVFVGAVFIIIGAGRVKKFQTVYKHTIVEQLVKSELGENAIYRANGMIPLNTILYPEFVKHPDRHHGEDYISGVYNDVAFEMCDINLEERHVHHDSKGHRHVTYESYFKGRFFIFDFNKEMNRILYIMPGNGKARKFKLEQFETESIAFNKKFNTFAGTQEDGFYILTPKLIERITQLSDLYKGAQYYAFLGGKLYIAINNKSDSLEVNVRKKIDEEALKKTRSDLRIAPAIINEFGLDKSKYTVEKYEETKVERAENDETIMEGIAGTDN